MYRLESSTEHVHRGVTHCRHCGLSFRAHSEEDVFCCSGCEYVYRLIKDEGLDRFYKLQGGKGQPVGSGVFSKRSYEWLKDLIRLSETEDSRSSELELSLSGLSCVGCVWLIETLFKKSPGTISCRIDVQRGLMRLSWQRGSFDGAEFARKLQSYGYELAPVGRKKDRGLGSIVWRMGVCGAFALNSMLYTLPGYLGMNETFAFSVHFEWLSFLFATLSMAFGGSYFIGRAFQAARNGVVHLDLPIAIGLLSAYGISLYGWAVGDGRLLYFDFVSTFVFLMLAGRWAQVVAVEKNRNRLSRLEVSAPEVEILGADGSFVLKEADALRPGDEYRICAGDWAPVESTLQSEKAQMGMEWINGESEPRVFMKGAEIPSGARQLGSGLIDLTAREMWSESLLKRLTDRKEENQDADKVVHVWISRYLITVVLLSVIGFLGWSFAGDVQTGIRAFVATLVISCPCALGIALPLADELVVAALRRNSVFVRSRTFWNRFSKVDSIAFDKTGTLTRLNLTLANPEELSSLDPESIHALSGLVADSRHPVSATLRELLMASGNWKPMENLEIREEIGKGVDGFREDDAWRLGKEDWVLGVSGESRTCFAKNGRPIAYFVFEDAPRNGVLEEVEALRSRGLNLNMLSGDARPRVERLARWRDWDLKSVFGEMSPEMKSDWLERRDPSRFLMIGDGANDSLAFASAACSGAPAIDQSLLSSQADFYYLGDGIQGARALFEARDARKKALRWLLSFAIGYNVIAGAFALSGWVTPLIAAVMMPASSIVSLAIVWLLLGRDDVHGRESRAG